MKNDLRIVRVHGDLALSGVTDETLVIRERDIRKGCAVSLIVFLHTNTTRTDVNKYIKNRMRDWLTSKLCTEHNIPGARDESRLESLLLSPLRHVEVAWDWGFVDIEGGVPRRGGWVLQ
jgi:hypothetical protein